jgi:hypothetical protein
MGPTKVLDSARAFFERSATSTAAHMPESETPDWKTYRNEKYGYSFQYPSNFELKTEGEDVITYPVPAPIEFGSSLRFKITNTKETLNIFINRFLTETRGTLIEQTSYVANGITWIRVVWTGESGIAEGIKMTVVDQFASKDNFIYSVEYIRSQAASNVVEQFEQIVKTIRFTK